MSYYGLDHYLTTDPTDYDMGREPDNDPLGIHAAYHRRELAATDVVFWERRVAELRRQLDLALIGLGSASRDLDDAEAEIAQMGSP